jgi:hypothetical protein
MVLGGWFWYAWFGSIPKVASSVRIPEPGLSGQLRYSAPGQLVFLHGGTLARHDVKAKKDLWSNVLIDKKQIAEDAKTIFKQMQDDWKKSFNSAEPGPPRRIPTLPELTANLEGIAAATLQLHVHGDHIWVSFPGKMVRFDWQTGKSVQEVLLNDSPARMIPSGDELLWISGTEIGLQQVTHVNLASGETRTEEFGEPTQASQAAGKATGAQPATRKATPTVLVKADEPGSQPLDPNAVATKVQNLPAPARLALPAMLAANANQQRLMAELRDGSQPPPTTPVVASSHLNTEPVRLVPTQNGFVKITTKMLETKVTQRKAMKDPPKKSALEGTVNASATTAIANEILNEMQRDRGGDVVLENVSRYRVTLRSAGAKEAAEWTGEVNGWPVLIPLQTVDVLTAGNSVLVFDKAHKKLWEAQLNFEVTGGRRERFGFAHAEWPYGEGPCVERGDTLYVFDQGVLTSFDVATGNVRWRLPSVNTEGLFFDDKGMIYVNTSTATPESIKFSRQIDVTQKVKELVLKLDPKTGKTLWKAEHEGHVSYVSGKFVYTAEAHPGEQEDEDALIKVGMLIPAHIRIKRLDPGNGRVLWEHYQQRAPLDVQFDKNSFQLLFKKEAQILKFIAF